MINGICVLFVFLKVLDLFHPDRGRVLEHHGGGSVCVGTLAGF